MRAWFTCCLLFVYFFCFAQEVNIDSLKRRLTNKGISDSNRIEILNTLAIASWRFNGKETKQWAKDALHLSERINYQKGMGDANLGIGLGKWTDGKFHKAIENMLLALEIHQNNGDSNAIAKTKYYIAVAYTQQAVIDLALQYFREIRAYYLHQENELMIAKVEDGIADAYLTDAQYKVAQPYISKSLKTWKRLGNPVREAAAQRRLGVVYVNTNQPQEAIELFDQALPIFEEYNELPEQMSTLKNMGHAYLNTDRVEMASQHLLKALDFAKELDDYDQQDMIYLLLKDLEEGRGNYREALHYYENYAKTHNYKISENISNQVHELKMKYDKQEAEHQIILLDKERKIQNTYLWGLSILIILIAISGTFLALFYRKGQRKDRALLKSKEALMEAEIANAKLKEKELTAELEQKNMKLTAYTMNFIQKGTLFKELSDQIEATREYAEGQVEEDISEMYKIVRKHLNVDKDWEDFTVYFESVHPSFVQGLKSKLPSISNAEVRLCTLLKLNLNSKQIADIMGISPDSVKTARHRLRNKLQLDRHQNLMDVMAEIG